MGTANLIHNKEIQYSQSLCTPQGHMYNIQQEKCKNVFIRESIQKVCTNVLVERKNKIL